MMITIYVLDLPLNGNSALTLEAPTRVFNEN